MLESVLQYDRAAFVFLNQKIANLYLDYFFAIVSCQFFWLPLLVISTVFLILRGGFRGRAFLVMAILCIGLGDGVVNRAIRNVVQKPRPHEVEIGARHVGLARQFPPKVRVRVRKNPKKVASGDSFTSGHVMNNVSVSSIAAALWPRLVLPLICWVFIICLSRVYNGAHYPIDVIGSVPIALLVAWCVWMSCNSFLWMLRKKYPRLYTNWLQIMHPRKSQVQKNF